MPPKDQFNPQQRQVIENLTGNLLVLAPAGTGKTNTISHRIIAILEQKLAAPEEILCLTFTNRACKEMEDRILAVVGEEGAGITVRTIHGFCYDLLRAYAPLTGGSRERSVWDDEDSAEALRGILHSLRMGTAQENEGGSGALAAMNFIELIKHRMNRADTDDLEEALRLVYAQDDKELREQTCLDASFRPDPALYGLLREKGGELFRRYSLRLQKDNAYDFPDLILETRRMLRNEAVLALVRSRYRYVHIDEVQDISDIEYDLITHLSPNSIYLLSGDGNQTIYGWRGSAPGIILPRFEREYGAETIRFDQNYRSSPGLLNLATRFSRNALGGGDPPPRSYTDHDLELAYLATVEEQTGWIYKKVRALPVGGDYSRVAVLARSNSACQAIADGFGAIQKASGDDAVRYMLSSEFKLFKRKEIKDILAFLRLILQPEDSSALRRIAENYSSQIGRKTTQPILAAISESEAMGAELSDFASPLTARYGDYFGLLAKALTAGKIIVFDVESTGVDICRDRIIQIAAIRIDQNAGVLEKFEEFLLPGKPVGDSFLVHGFSDKYIAERGGEPSQILPRFLEFIRGGVVVGHNVSYDMGILSQELLRHGLPSPEIAGVYDTLSIARRFLPHLENHKLSTLAELFRTPNRPTHNAMDDILATGQILARFAEEYIRPMENARRQLYAAYLPRFDKLREGMEGLRREAETMATPGFVRHLAEGYGIRAKYRKEPERLENLDAFLRFVEDGLFEGGNRRENLFRLLEYSSLSSSELDRMSRSSNKMAIITIHQAKGCEFDYVVVPSLVEDQFPSFKAVQSGVLEEEARLFYVAITRARKKLFLCSYRVSPRTGRPTTPSRFLDMI